MRQKFLGILSYEKSESITICYDWVNYYESVITHITKSEFVEIGTFQESKKKLI